MNVPSVDLGSTEHKYPWHWYLKDLNTVKKNGLKVFSCFACGGGSSMGYKLAGYDVLGNCEIDPRIAAVYKANLHPKYSFVMDCRDFAKLPREDIPEGLLHLDVLDGSPPCSVFSSAGEREAAWNKEKRFAEGQKLQRLDDLFFTFIEIANLLQPKVVIAENVKGLILGNAKGYVHDILQCFRTAGYETQIFLLNAKYMGVPQKRERVFFIARRKDLALPPVKLAFHEQPILFKEVRSPHGKPFKGICRYSYLLTRRIKTDSCIADICKRLGVKVSGFNHMITHDDDVAFTLTASGNHFRYYDACYFSDVDIRNVATFPQDYNFTRSTVQFICGMSVPPVMMANVASSIATQIFGK